MKLLFAYTLDCLRRNRRSSIAITIAILMTSTMLAALSSFMFNIYSDNLSLILRQTGNWHGELFDNTPATVMPIIEGFDSVESIMIKGDWKTAKIDDPRRDYLVWRDANAPYWESMPEGDLAILEGRAPAADGEIALSKQYFEHHPELRLGDTITLPIGNRVAPDDSVIAPQDTKKSGERFEATGTVALTVVGKLDVTTSSTVPAYTALGFLDRAAIKPDDNLTVYFRFHNIHDTYKELPRIAEAVGYQPDEYGNYLLRYNLDYLTRKAVLSPEQIGFLPLLLANQAPIAFAITALLVVGLFVLIIHNAFALSSAARLTQLGIFASVGATPKQIKWSVALEGLLLTVIPLPVGLVLGQLSVAAFISYSNAQANPSYYEPVMFVVGWQSVLPAILLTLLTVLWSALIPARRVARLSPIVAIRQGSTDKLGKLRRRSFGKLFGITGELAANALQARKKSYRTATISLTLSFVTLIFFLCINSASTTSRAVYRSGETLWDDQDIALTLRNVATEQDFDEIRDRVIGLPAIADTRWYNNIRTVAWLPEDSFSDEFDALGGFPAIEGRLSDTQVPLLRDGKRRVGITIIGLDNDTFAQYCGTLGLDPAQFYDEGQWRSILYNTVSDITTGTKRNPVKIPFLDVAAGGSLTQTETTIDSYEGDFTFDMEIAAVADQMPSLSGATFGVRYSVLQFMPMSRVKQLAGSFARSNVVGIRGVLEVSDPALITPTREAIAEACESYFGSGDYDVFDENEYRLNDENSNVVTALMFGFIVALLAVIGLSNAWSTVRGTLNARRREFAMLRSVGLPPRELRRMLTLEAAMLGFAPILVGLPLAVALQCILLYINEVTFVEWLPYAPWLPMLLYIVAVLGVTIAAYTLGGRKLLDENIIEAIKIDSI